MSKATPCFAYYIANILRSKLRATLPSGIALQSGLHTVLRVILRLHYCQISNNIAYYLLYIACFGTSIKCPALRTILRIIYRILLRSILSDI